MRTRLRAPGGALTLTLPEDATVRDLIAQIKEKTSISSFDVKYGYPPQPLLLEEYEGSQALDKLGINLDGEQLTISARDPPVEQTSTVTNKEPAQKDGGKTEEKDSRKPIGLKKKTIEGEVPELPMPSRGATLVMRVMPDDNSCLFRAFGAAVLPGDDASMPELRSLVASAIQAQPEVYSKVVLEQEPDDYCRWIQTQDAWGGAIEMGILSKHFDIEICSIDVQGSAPPFIPIHLTNANQSLRIDKFNEEAVSRCILVYSGIHYDTIVQSPSDYPHTKANYPPELDKRVWDSDDNEILEYATELAKKLQAKHYFTDTGGMAIKCNVCGQIVYGEGQASGHAQQTGHYDMAEVHSQ